MHDGKCGDVPHAVRSYPDGCFCWCHDLTIEEWTRTASLYELERWTYFKAAQRTGFSEFVEVANGE